MSGDLSVYDDYAETNELDKMIRNQLDKLDCLVNHGGDLFLLSWTLTQSPGDAPGCLIGAAPSIIELAREAIGALGAILNHPITSAKVPNVVYVDVSPVQATEVCIAINQGLGNNQRLGNNVDNV